MPLPADKLMVCPVLIGRERFLAALTPILHGVTSGSGRMVAISGEAGLGKSRLVNEAKQRIAGDLGQDNFRVLQGNCFEPDNSLPYAPFIDLLRSCIDKHDLDEVRECLGPEAPDIATLVPELTTLLPGLAPSPAVEPEQEKRRIFHAVAEFLVRLSNNRPLMIVIEDAHWSDDSSLELLTHLARRIKTQRIVVFLTFRSDEAQPPLRKVLNVLSREHVLLEWPLERLGPDGVESMMQAIFELSAPVRSEFVDAIYALTEGNPFFIEEVLKSMVAAGDIFFADGAWDRKPLDQLEIPQSIQAAVGARTSQLGSDAQRTLVIAAVAGRRFDFDLLQAMTAHSESSLLGIIKELMSAQLVAEESADRFVFRHALTQQTIYNSLLARERRSLHREIAAALQRLASPSVDSSLPDLAHHFYAAESWDEAYSFCCRQGEAAQNMNAPSVAALQFARAIEAAEHLGVAVPAATFRARGQALEATGRFDGALADYERTLAMAESAGDGPAECQALLDIGFLWAGRDYARAGDFFRRANDLAARLNDPVLEARALNRFGNWLVNTGDTAEGVTLHERALAAFRQVGNDAGVAETLDLLGMAYALNGDQRSGVHALTDAIDLLRLQGATALLCSSLSTRATWAGPNQSEFSYSAVLGFEQCERDALEAISIASQLDSPAALSYAHWIMGAVYEGFGHFDDAARHAAEGLRLAIEIDHEQWTAGSQFILGRLALSMLTPERAIEHLRESMRLARALGSSWWLGNSAAYLAVAHIQTGDLDAAESILASAWPESNEPRGYSERRVLWAWGRLSLARGKPEHAVLLADRVIASASGAAGEPQPIPELLRLKGEAQLDLRHPETAAPLLEEARDAAIAREATPQLWPIHASLARAYHALRRTGDAERECAAARRVINGLASSIGDTADRERFEGAALATLPRLRAPSENRRAKETFGGLTAREREVAALVARGKSNREIADDLVLGERTIETHVGNILSKLGFTTRVQIAAWVVEVGLTTAS